MVSYTKARAESIGVECNVGMMERPERLICLIAGALLDLLTPALWVLAILANLTAVQRIVFTRRMMRAEPRRARVLLPLLVAALLLLPSESNASAEAERAWSRAVAAFQQGEAGPLAHAFATEAALASPIGDYGRRRRAMGGRGAAGPACWWAAARRCRRCPWPSGSTGPNGCCAVACRRPRATRPSASPARRATPASWCARCAWSATRRRAWGDT